MTFETSDSDVNMNSQKEAKNERVKSTVTSFLNIYELLLLYVEHIPFHVFHTTVLSLGISP